MSHIREKRVARRRKNKCVSIAEGRERRRNIEVGESRVGEGRERGKTEVGAGVSRS